MDDRAEAKAKFGRLPAPIDPEDMVESQPEPPPPEPETDANAQAIYRYGLPL